MEGPVPTDGPVGLELASVSTKGSRRGRAAVAGLTDLRLGEFTVLLPLLALIIYLGVVPGVLTARMESTVNGLLPGANAGQINTSGFTGSVKLGATSQAYILVSSASDDR